MSEADDAIAESAAGPKRVQVDGMGSSEEHSLPDQIAAAKYAANANANSPAKGFGLRFVKMNPPSAR